MTEGRAVRRREEREDLKVEGEGGRVTCYEVEEEWTVERMGGRE